MKKTFKSIKDRILKKTDQYILRGSIVRCDMCDWNGKRFPKGRCPKCKSLARTRLIPYSINYFKLDLNNSTILHVAPNVSEYNFIKSNFKTQKYDRLNLVDSRHINLVRDLTDTKLESNIYDLIIIWHVLEHIPEDRKAILEMFRILKEDGKVLMSVPIYPKENLTTYEDDTIKREDFEKIHGHSDHCRSCGLDYYKRFEDVGFKTSTLNTKELNKEERTRYGLSNSHTSWLFTKA